MGITFGDHLIDSGHHDITPEQERERDEMERKKQVLASWSRVENDDPPLRWLLRELRDIAERWAADPQQPLNDGGPTTHICFLAADLIEAAKDFRERMDHAESVLEEQDRVRENRIKYMVDRFLMWKFPQSVNPDGGFSLNRIPGHDAVGTNLLSAVEADAMVRHMIAGLP